MVLAFGNTMSAGVIFVDSAASGTNSGNSWGNAYTHLQDALDRRMSDGSVDSILVASGTYYPGKSPDGTSTDLRDRAFFLLDSNVLIIGGYNASTGLPTEGTSTLSTNSGSYHIMLTGGLSNATLFQSLEFRGGNANGTGSLNPGAYSFDRSLGGGLSNRQSNLRLRRCIFSANNASSGGAGMYNHQSHVVLSDVVFTLNTSSQGAAIHNFQSNLNANNILFYTNAGTDGVLYNSASSPVLNALSFIDNSGSFGTGGIYNTNSFPRVNNSLFFDGRTDITNQSGSNLVAGSGYNASEQRRSSHANIGFRFENPSTYHRKNLFTDSSHALRAV